MNNPTKSGARVLMMFTLILAGEAIFFMPFVLPRIFRATLLDVFQMTNLQLGTLFSTYGLVAMGAYFFGGPLADGFSPRTLLSVALALTGLAGTLMLFIPSHGYMMGLYAFWGLSTILLFWSALLKATRSWGTPTSQGQAFGWLDGGRGAVAAIIATVSVSIFSFFLPNDGTSLTAQERIDAFRLVIAFISLLTVTIAALVWMVLPKETSQNSSQPFSFSLLTSLLKKRVIWVHSIIIVCAYVGYKVTDDFSLYAKEVLGYSEVDAAALGTLALWVRPLVAVVAGFVADKVSVMKSIIFHFVLMTIGGLLVGYGLARGFFFFYIVMLTVCIGVYALRGLYFALLEETKTSMEQTGITIGLISVIGFTPDIFFGPLMGYLLDEYPGALGHQYVFICLAGFGALGGIVTAWYHWSGKKEASTV